MDNFNLVLAIIILSAIVVAYLLGRLHQKSLPQTTTDFIEIYKIIQDLPGKILQSIQGSINPQKGKMAELLIYAELRYDYDRIIPLGWPIDFIGIKNNQKIDFIEVKSGLGDLTVEEKHIKNLITEGRVNFRLIKVTEEEIQKFITAKKP
mgnify:CR=1 FL=1